MSNTKVYLAPMEGLTDYMFRNAFDEFFGHGKIDKYFMPFISPNQTEKFLAKEMRDIDRNNNLINSIPQIMTNNSEDFICFLITSDIMKLTLMQAVPLEQSFPNQKAQECLQILTGLNAYFMK